MGMFSKVRALTLGNLHELVDKTIDLNSPAVLKQYVRDLETGIDQLKSEAVIQGGACRTLDREIASLKTRIEAKTTAIKNAMTNGVPNTDPALRASAVEVNTWTKELEQKKTDEAEALKSKTSLDDAVYKLNSKHTEMVGAIRRLESAVHSTTAQNRAVNAMEQAGSMSAGVDGTSVDNLQAHIQEKKDIADERFDRAMHSDAFAEPEGQAGEVDALLTSLK
jgi:phage shock protein A